MTGVPCSQIFGSDISSYYTNNRIGCTPGVELLQKAALIAKGNRFDLISKSPRQDILYPQIIVRINNIPSDPLEP